MGGPTNFPGDLGSIAEKLECKEIASAFDWAQSSYNNFVVAYFTWHRGFLTDPTAPTWGSGGDFCLYATGLVEWQSSAGTLLGNLDVYTNGGTLSNTGAMEKEPDVTLRVEIFPFGGITYQRWKNYEPVDPAPIKVTTTCLGGVLLTAANEDEVITLGLRRVPTIPPPH